MLYQVAYTFDAGPNACLYLREEDVPLVLSLIKHFFPPLSDKDFVQGRPVHAVEINQVFKKKLLILAHFKESLDENPHILPYFSSRYNLENKFNLIILLKGIIGRLWDGH